MRTKAIQARPNRRTGKRRTIKDSADQFAFNPGIGFRVAELPHSDKKEGARDRKPRYNVFVSICFPLGGTPL